VLNEVVQYYANNNTPVHAIFLDANKAFDKVHYIKLFRLLLKKGMNPVIIRFLLNSYTNQTMYVRWNDELSRGFDVWNGVKQGGVLSPVLFTVYFDHLLCVLRDCGVGCYVGSQFLGALAYADDVVLLAPTKASAHIMLNVAQSFAKDFNVTFNESKTKHVLFNAKGDNVNILFNGSAIDRTDFEFHLGNIVGPNSNLRNIKRSVNLFNARVNELLSVFSHTNIDVKYHLFKTYCMPLYGSQLWDVSHKDIELFYVAWRKAIRRLFNLPYKTHCVLLSHICRDESIDVQIRCRIVKFINNISSCAIDNSCVRIAYNLMLDGSGSSVCNSMSDLSQKLNVDRYSLYNVSHSDVRAKQSYKQTDICTASALRDRISIRDNKTNGYVQRQETICWIDCLCTA
jgi:hypothetical protein